MEATQLVQRCFSSDPKYTQIKAGLPEDYTSIKTIRDLLEINYKLVEAKEQLRRNLISVMKSGGQKYPGIIGYDDDVAPALDRAILSCHDMHVAFSRLMLAYLLLLFSVNSGLSLNL